MFIREDSILKFIEPIKACFKSESQCKVSDLPKYIPRILNTNLHKLHCMFVEGNFDDFSIPEGITRIGDYAFYDCDNLALTSLPDGITRIGDYAFYGCDNLALISLPESLISIGGQQAQPCQVQRRTIVPSLFSGF